MYLEIIKSPKSSHFVKLKRLLSPLPPTPLKDKLWYRQALMNTQRQGIKSIETLRTRSRGLTLLSFFAPHCNVIKTEIRILLCWDVGVELVCCNSDVYTQETYGRVTATGEEFHKLKTSVKL